MKDYRRAELDRLDSTTFYRLHLSSDSDGAESRHLNISGDERDAIADILDPPSDRFTLTIDTAGAAFEEEPATELARLLRHIADSVESTYTGSHEFARDTNGNTVARWTLT